MTGRGSTREVHAFDEAVFDAIDRGFVAYRDICRSIRAGRHLDFRVARSLQRLRRSGRIRFVRTPSWQIVRRAP
jgi:hypothetical protein